MSDTGCIILDPVEFGRILCGDWAKDRLCAEPADPTPTDGGRLFDIRPGADSLNDWNFAIDAMGNGGGNVVRFLPGVHPAEYRVRGDNIVGPNASAPLGKNGVSGNHNWAFGLPGHEIQASQTIDPVFAYPAVSIEAVNYWNVVKMNITASDFYGIRLALSQNDPASPSIVGWNNISGTNHGGIKIRGWFNPIGGDTQNYGESSHVEVLCNDIGGPAAGTPEALEFREAIYLGAYGGQAPIPNWVDSTNNVRIAYNDLHDMNSDLVDLKTGTYLIVVEDNLGHDNVLAPGSNSTSFPVGHFTGQWANEPPPVGHPGADPRTIFRRNRLWNLSSAGSPVRYPIALGYGTQTAEANIGWGNEADHLVAVTSSFSAGSFGSGTKTIRCNGSDDSAYVIDPGGFGFPVSTSIAGNTPNDGAIQVIGPVTGTADAGEGPGSGFAPQAPCPLTGPGCIDATGSCTNTCAGPLMEDQR